MSEEDINNLKDEENNIMKLFNNQMRNSNDDSDNNTDNNNNFSSKIVKDSEKNEGNGKEIKFLGSKRKNDNFIENKKEFSSKSPKSTNENKYSHFQNVNNIDETNNSFIQINEGSSNTNQDNSIDFGMIRNISCNSPNFNRMQNDQIMNPQSMSSIDSEPARDENRYRYEFGNEGKIKIQMRTRDNSLLTMTKNINFIDEMIIGSENNENRTESEN